LQLLSLAELERKKLPEIHKEKIADKIINSLKKLPQDFFFFLWY